MSDDHSFARLAAETTARPPELALVLGSGLGELACRCEAVCRVPFADVPGLASPSVLGHRGRLTLGDWAGKRVLLFEGRLHHYEGHPWRSVVRPVQIAHFLGARILLMTNAAGGIHDALGPGSLMAIRDHLEWTRPYCWRQPGPGALGPARPSPYAPRLLDLLMRAAQSQDIALRQGVYGAVTGPCYGAPAGLRERGEG